MRVTTASALWFGLSHGGQLRLCGRPVPFSVVAGRTWLVFSPTAATRSDGGAITDDEEKCLESGD